MTSSLGLTIPLAIVLGFQTLLGVLLLSPKPLCTPAKSLCRSTNSYTGRTVVTTIASVLLILFASPAYDAYKISQADVKESSRSEQEAQTLLVTILIAVNLLLIFALRKLGNALSDIDRMKLSEGAMLKQVQGLQAEYSRLQSTSDSQPGKSAQSSETATLRSKLDKLSKEVSELQERTEEAERAKQTAEANCSALKSQSKGLEYEYDRLLAENDELKRRISRLDPAAAASDYGKKGN